MDKFDKKAAEFDYWTLIDFAESYHQAKVKENDSLHSVSNRSKTKRVSSDGVFFRCDNCGHEPKMASDTDDLLQMHYCPKCGSEFE